MEILCREKVQSTRTCERQGCISSASLSISTHATFLQYKQKQRWLLESKAVSWLETNTVARKVKFSVLPLVRNWQLQFSLKVTESDNQSSVKWHELVSTSTHLSSPWWQNYQISTSAGTQLVKLVVIRTNVWPRWPGSGSSYIHTNFMVLHEVALHCKEWYGHIGDVQCGGLNIVKSIRDGGKNARRFVKFRPTTTTVLQSGPDFLSEKSGRLQRLSWPTCFSSMPRKLPPSYSDHPRSSTHNDSQSISWRAQGTSNAILKRFGDQVHVCT